MVLESASNYCNVLQSKFNIYYEIDINKIYENSTKWAYIVLYIFQKLFETMGAFWFFCSLNNSYAIYSTCLIFHGKNGSTKQTSKEKNQSEQWINVNFTSTDYCQYFKIIAVVLIVLLLSQSLWVIWNLNKKTSTRTYTNLCKMVKR